MGQIIAYARVSTDKQEFDRQVDALKSHGYDKLIQEKFTGTKRDRDGLNRLVEVVRSGDTIIVESLSRLGRNTIDILKLIDDLYTQGIAVKSLKEATNNIYTFRKVYYWNIRPSGTARKRFNGPESQRGVAIR